MDQGDTVAMSRSSAPVFVVGSSRSGTALVSACINYTADINVTRETHYFDDLRPKLLDRGGETVGGSIADRAVRYFRSVDAAPYGHNGDPAGSAITDAELRSLGVELGGRPDDFFAAYCTIKARHRGKTRWGEKTPRHVYRIAEILSAFPDAKVIQIVRDPRAVVASYRDYDTHGEFDEERRKAFDRDVARARRSYHPFLQAWMWNSAIGMVASYRRAHGADSVYVLRYEDLVTDPEPALRALCAFLETDYTEAMLGVAMNNSSYTRFQDRSGFSKTAAERWRKTLTDREIAAVQARCKKLMVAAGYEIEPVGRYPLTMAKLWLTLPVVAVRAVLANRSRFASLPDYLWRRIRHAARPSRSLPSP